ncbi:hypothetical protein [Helicobacter ganmani]|uniref:Uncharacterized protein n=1 Tax=Helicobacter ganmani TaxID=60246 RepID=A0A3D8IH01_9HELI|nr:hypothetical protein [Helicobacter ganmani]RDU64557.1 hypothetical protein CQA43_01815 [Helicobacter ganmani]
MTKQEFNEALKALNLTKKEFCEKLRVNYTSLVSSWFRVVPIPQYAISWLELYKTAQKYEQVAEIFKKEFIFKGQESTSFTRKEFEARLQELKLTRIEFCKKVGMNENSILANWDRQSPIPLWVEAWLNTYENTENFKKLEILFEGFIKT